MCIKISPSWLISSREQKNVLLATGQKQGFLCFVFTYNNSLAIFLEIHILLKYNLLGNNSHRTKCWVCKTFWALWGTKVAREVQCIISMRFTIYSNSLSKCFPLTYRKKVPIKKRQADAQAVKCSYVPGKKTSLGSKEHRDPLSVRILNFQQ